MIFYPVSTHPTLFQLLLFRLPLLQSLSVSLSLSLSLSLCLSLSLLLSVSLSLSLCLSPSLSLSLSLSVYFSLSLSLSLSLSVSLCPFLLTQGLVPDAESYGMMIQSCGHRDLLVEGLKMLEEVTEKGASTESGGKLLI